MISRRTLLGAASAGAFTLAAGRAAAADPRRRPLPPWFDEVKLGVFVHWNAAAIPAFAPVHLLRDLAPPSDPDLPLWQQQQIWRTLPYAEMYQNTMAVPGSETSRYHAERYGDVPYDGFVEQFRDRMIPAWDPRPWAELFEQAGAGYVVLTTKTEDGFLLWPSAHTNPGKRGWQSARDVVGELANAVRARGMRFGTYYSEGMDWTFGGLPITDNTKLVEALPRGERYAKYTDAHWRELVARYRPSVLWNDYGFLPNLDAEALFETYYAAVPDGVVNDRFDMGRPLPADFVTLEYAETTGPADRKWEACRGIGTSFGYNRLESDASCLSETGLVRMFADIVAHGGNLLINVGPTGSGQIPPEQRQRLLALGKWLRTNGDAIYRTRPWERAKGITTMGQQIRYTASETSINAIVFDTPGPVVEIDMHPAANARVTLAGSKDQLRWEPTTHGARVHLPRGSARQPAFTLRIWH
ncbi:alpha-L-fucosidase [Kibdelosporangium persicum]|uniref:alpha-L-fucosidase n=1 Tax=Kibdelosporangium persicum TaxID=2698649 RepID=A0ABX2FBS6_9PSEU|nr:alpha-L-fucosidase [Kibdelosporangium persicum]NRN68845.1 Alpha-L-fucosidase [Kibdelosporangium persicum]